MENLQIRRLSSGDVGALVPGIVRVFRDDEVVPWHRPDECLAFVDRSVKRGFYITVAYYDGEIVGYSEWIITHDDGRKLLYLGIMQVDPDLRGRGIGTAMLEDGKRHAKSVDVSYLRTIPEDERAKNFYHKNGFAVTDEIWFCSCPVKMVNNVSKAAPVALALETSEFIFGLCQSSGNHMYEIANHNPECSKYNVITTAYTNGYLQFRYREESTTATALYWSTQKPTSETVAAILERGQQAGFEEIEFYFRAKYCHLLGNYNVSRESEEMERKIL